MRDIRNESTTELLARALELSRGDPVGETHERWDVIVELHRRPEEVVARKALGWCSSEDPIEQVLGIDILGQLGFAEGRLPFREESLPVLEGLLSEHDERVVASTLIAIHHFGPAESLWKVVRLAAHASADVRYAVAFAVSGQSDPRAVSTLIELSSDSAPSVRDWATSGLGPQMDDDTREIRDALLRRVADPDADTRAEALSGLVKRQDARVVAPLKKALKLPSVGTLEVQAAADVADPALLPELEALKSWWDVDTSLLEEAIARCRAARRSGTQV